MSPSRPLLRSIARIVAVLGSSVALAASAASAAPPLDAADARHLLARVGFGPTPQEVQRFTGLSRDAAATILLDGMRTSASTPPPSWALDRGPLRYPRAADDTSLEERKAFAETQRREGQELRAWWIGEMIATPSPLTERMTLFWHNHFVSGQQKVKLARLLYEQNVTLRRYAGGNFGEMLHAIARDPAMAIYLDGARSRKGNPNENFARELLELFTLGEGAYGEHDVKEAARAFTGFGIDRETGSFRFRPLLHDMDAKTVLGVTIAPAGERDGDAVLDLLLARPETAELVARKLWRELVSPDADPAEIARVAAAFRDSRYEVKSALRAIFTSDAFYARENRGTLVKSPVDLVVGTARQLGIAPSEPALLAAAASAMGQSLFAPPNVKGWPGNDAWINARTLLARKQFLDRIVRTTDTRTLPRDPDERLLLAVARVSAPEPADNAGDRVRAILADDAYELK